MAFVARSRIAWGAAAMLLACGNAEQPADDCAASFAAETVAVHAAREARTLHFGVEKTLEEEQKMVAHLRNVIEQQVTNLESAREREDPAIVDGLEGLLQKSRDQLRETEARVQRLKPQLPEAAAEVERRRETLEQAQTRRRRACP